MDCFLNIESRDVCNPLSRFSAFDILDRMIELFSVLKKKKIHCVL